MTIAAAYLVSEGVVFGADSTTTISTSDGVVQMLNHAQKLFEVGSPGRGRIALCTWGNASIGNVSHRTIAARLSDRINETTTVFEAATRILPGLINEEVMRQKPPNGHFGEYGYFLGGVDAVDHTPACALIEFQNENVNARSLNIGEAAFQGAPEYFTRVFHGFDPRLPDSLLAELQKRIGSAVPNLEVAFAESFMAAVQSLPGGGARNLPIREAIDYVHTYLHITVKAFKFRFGPPICGGPLEVGFVSTDRPFRWVRHKPFDAALLEPLDDEP